MAFISLSFLQGSAQQFFSENFGTLTATDAEQNISDYNGYQYAAPITYSGTAKVSGSVISAGYQGSSGASNIAFQPSTAQYLTVSGINTSGYSSESITMTFGYYKASPTDQDIVVEYSTNGTDFYSIEYNRFSESGWEAIIINDIVPSVNNLTVRFTQTSGISMRIDDLRFRTAIECPLRISAITRTCNENTDGTDIYTVYIPFNNGGTQSYGITSTLGTITGDNPSTQEQGVIQIVNIEEGRSLSVNIAGTLCDYRYSVTGLQCKPEQQTPFYESFNYPAESSLTNYSGWSASTVGGILSIQSGSLSHPSMPSGQNSLKINRSGRDAYLKFIPVSSGKTLASFIFNVEDLGVLIAENENTMVASFSESMNFARNNIKLLVQKIGTNYKIGISYGNENPVYTPATYSLNENLFIILGYDFTTNNVMGWVNPDVNTINNTTPTISVAASIAPADLGNFSIYQNGVTANLDELKIGTTLQEVTTSILANNALSATEFTISPNPLTGGNVLNIQSAQNGTKLVAIYDMMGKQVFTETTASGTIAPQLSTGLYMVKVTENNVSTVKKLVVN